MTTETINVTLTPADVTLAAADLIERQGKANKYYFTKTDGLAPREAPVCVLGAIAVVCGFEPHAWEDDPVATGRWRLVLDTADLLVDWLGIDHVWAHTIPLGPWSDGRDQATVVRELRDAAGGLIPLAWPHLHRRDALGHPAVGVPKTQRETLDKVMRPERAVTA
ncbi:DUF6197 family protein [Nonomuraea sp. NPDC004297]